MVIRIDINKARNNPMMDCHIKSCEFSENTLVPNPCDTCHVKNIKCCYATSYITQNSKRAICLSRKSGSYGKYVDESFCLRCKSKKAGELTLKEEISVIKHLSHDYYGNASACEFVGLMKKAQSQKEKGSYFAGKLSKLTPDDISICIYLGESCGNRETARVCFLKAIKYYSEGWRQSDSLTNPEHKAKAIVISDLYKKLAQTESSADKAIEVYTKALEINPDNSDAYFCRGNVYAENMRNYPQAIKDYTEAIKISSRNKYIYERRGCLYRRMREYDKAIEDYTQIQDLSQRGRLYVKIKAYDKAVADYSADIEHNTSRYAACLKEGWAPYVAPAYLRRAILFLTLHRYADAIKDCTKAIELNPHGMKSYKVRSAAYKKSGSMAEAARDIEKYKMLLSATATHQEDSERRIREDLEQRLDD